MKSPFTLIVGCAVMAAALAGCKQDPKAEARLHLDKGNKQMAQEQIPEAIIEYRRAVQSDPRLGDARLKLAAAFASVGDARNALKEYARAADLMPEEHEAQLKAGNYMLLTGQYQDAQGVANRMLERKTDDVDAQILYANSLAGLKDMDGAIQAFEKAVELDPKRAASYAELGSAQQLKGDNTAAEAAFRKALALDPNSANAHLSLSNFLWATGRLPEAEAEIKRALDIDSKNVVANRAMAMFKMVTNKAAEAEPYLKLVADVTPGADSKYFLAEYFLRLGRVDDARATLTPLLSNDALFVPASIRLARVEVVAKKDAEANRILEGALAREPKNVEALITMGRLRMQEGNTIGALTMLQTAVEANPNSTEAQLALAQTYAVREQRKEATAAFNEVLKLDAKSTDARLGLARLYMQSGTPQDGVQLVGKVVAEQPGNVEARLLLFHGLLAAGDIPQAANTLNVLMQQSPGSASVQTAAGLLATVKNDSESAKRAYQRALDADPRAYQALAGLLTAEMSGKQFGNAKALIEKQLAANPNDPNVLLMAAQTYNAMGDTEGSERSLKKTVDLDPTSLQAYAMLGKLYYQQGRLDLARRELETLTVRQPKSVPAQTMLGTILELQGNKDEAKDRYGRALQIDPRAPVAANNLAWLNSNTNGNLDMALQLAQTAKAQMPNRHEIDDTLGWIYYKKGLSTLAIESLTASAEKQPNNPNYLYHLGLAYAQNGDKEQARKTLEKALKTGATFEGAADAKRVLESSRE